MKRNMIRAFVAVAMVAGLAVVLGAQPPQGGQGMRGQHMGPGGQMGMGGRGGMAALNLTTEQQAKIQALMQAQRTEHQAMADQLRTKRQALRDALFGDNPDSAKAIAADLATLEAQMQPARIDMEIAVVKLLTPEQRQKAKELDLFGRMGMGAGPMGPGRGGPGRGGHMGMAK